MIAQKLREDIGGPAVIAVALQLFGELAVAPLQGCEFAAGENGGGETFIHLEIEACAHAWKSIRVARRQPLLAFAAAQPQSEPKRRIQIAGCDELLDLPQPVAECSPQR